MRNCARGGLPSGENKRMVKRMLIDASHAEETRVVVASGTRLEEFDFESASRRQIKGNVYLAKVMRVEPSLQAAFVDYGGNRHGFLPFGEIHPDYYQIPVEDREALYKEQEAAGDAGGPGPDEDAQASDSSVSQPVDDAPAPEDVTSEAADPGTETESEPESSPDSAQDADSTKAEADNGGDGDVEVVGGEEMDELERRRLEESRALLSKRYRIQEVIKRRQILLVQVVKDERGTKGAALTTYLSLAGRYIVLMPNTIRGGGISRKIVSAEDRRRLKAIMNGLEIPARMGIIVRTAGLSRSKAEIKRDFDYLLRRWQDIRELTLKSAAPCIIHEEANLIRRAIRDLYMRDIEEILVEGDEGYRTAKSFMKTLIPSHARKVKPYKERIPLFTRYSIEKPLDSMYSSEVKLKSGGYLVIDPTEALVSIDVNSGRATRERNIEETALRTNLEAADEVARQLRLRDLAGLVVIDFIDMNENRHRRAVERTFKEAVRNDRARTQIGRISAFGLLELSRQRLRPSLLEASMERCPHCHGSGMVRTVESAAVQVLRAIEEEGLRERSAEIAVHTPTAIALYILNRKRQMLAELEQRYDFAVRFQQDDSLVSPNHKIERLLPREGAEVAASEERSGSDDAAEAGETPKRRSRRRRKGRAEAQDAASVPVEAETQADSGGDKDESPSAKRRRRGKRGGRRRTAKTRDANREVEAAAPPENTAPDAESDETLSGPRQEEAAPDMSDPGMETAISAPSPIPDPDPAPEAEPPRPMPTAVDDSEIPDAGTASADGETTVEPAGEPPASERPPRRGWWQVLGASRS